MTLVKAPGYPLYIAANYALHIPLQFAQQLLYALSCLLLLWAIGPWRLPWPIRLLLLAILLFNPMSFHTGPLARVRREGIYPAQSLMVLACAMGLLVRARWPIRRLLAWSCGLGLLWGWFWLTRDEGVWLVPSVGLLLAVCLFRIWRMPTDRWRRILACLACPVLVLAMINAVCLVNLTRYGVYTTGEFRSPAFLDAYGALSRITPASFHPKIPVPRECRDRAYAVSPTFARLRPYLEGDTCQRWIDTSRGTTIEHDFAGGWFGWAFRDAADAGEHFQSAAEAMRFYQAMADEINAACDQGRLPAGPRHSSMVSSFDLRYLPAARIAFFAGVRKVITFDDFEPDVSGSRGRPELISQFATVTRSSTSATQPVTSTSPSIRQTMRKWIGRGYQNAVAVLTAASVVVVMLYCRRWWRQQRELLLLLVALAGAILLRLAMLAWIDATSFDAIKLFYLSPLYALVLMFGGIVLCGLVPARGASDANQQ